MTYVITQNCCNDASCVPVCPVNCIHPTPDEPDYGITEMLYIDPDGCIECGACLDACPVSAIEPDWDLPAESLPFIALNAVYYDDPEHQGYSTQPYRSPEPSSLPGGDDETLRVAVIGTGPAASYAVEHLLGQRGLQVKVDVFERLLTPWGLVRFGVAPDHAETKAASDSFTRSLRHRDVRVFFDVTVGEDISHDDLAARYHAVVYGVGASVDRRLHIEGEDMPGSVSATDVVSWYNGYPGASAELDPSAQRAVIIGNGNVALDVARLLATSPEDLRRTDVAEPLVEWLAQSQLAEVRVVGRRGADASAFTTPELLGLREALGRRLIRCGDLGPAADDLSAVGRFRREVIEALPTEAPDTDEPVVVLDYLRTPVALLGDEVVAGVRFVATGSSDEPDDLDCGIVIRSVGYRSVPVAGLPFDARRAVVPSQDGRVLQEDSEEVMAGVYVTGWIKRGPSGVIGTNRHCARETVASLLEDRAEGRLVAPTEAGDVADLLSRDRFDFDDWRHLDSHERSSGRAKGRPRDKVVSREDQLEVLRSRVR